MSTKNFYELALKQEAKIFPCIYDEKLRYVLCAILLHFKGFAQLRDNAGDYYALTNSSKDNLKTEVIFALNIALLSKNLVEFNIISQDLICLSIISTSLIALENLYEEVKNDIF